VKAFVFAQLKSGWQRQLVEIIYLADHIRELLFYLLVQI
jgi:hypothetical protein